MQPPTLCTAHKAITGRIIIEDIDGNKGPLACSRDKGGLIMQAKVLTEPDNGGTAPKKSPLDQSIATVNLSLVTGLSKR